MNHSLFSREKNVKFNVDEMIKKDETNKPKKKIEHTQT